MLLWTNAPPDPDALTRSLELFLCSFRDEKTHRHICGDCDVALISEWRTTDDGIAVEPAVLRLVVPRDPGTFGAIAEWWHVSTMADYPHTGYELTANGFLGYQAANDGDRPMTRRYALRMVPQLAPDGIKNRSIVDAIDLWPLSYQDFLQRAYRSRLMPWAVVVDDLRKLIRLKQVDQFFKHQEFSLEPEYQHSEYL